MKMNKIDYVLQLSVYHDKEMQEKGFSSYKDLKKLTLPKLKELFKEVLR